MALVGLGKVALIQGDFKNAVRHLEAALVQQPNASTIQYNLGMAYRGLGDVASAQNFLARVPEGTRNQTPVVLRDPLLGQLEQFRLGSRRYRDLATVALQQGRYEAALEDCRKAVEIAPNRPENRHLLARVLLRMGRLEEAADVFREVVRLSPEKVASHNSLASVLTSLGNLAEAESHLQTALRLDPRAAETHFNLGNLRRAQGRCGAARLEYAAAVEQESSNFQASFWSAVCLVRMQRYREAEAALTEDAQRFPKVSEFAMLRARLLASAAPPELRNGQKALRLAQEAFASRPTLNGAETVAMAYAELGQYEAAVRWQQAALVSAQIAGRTEVAQQVQKRLDLYEERRPCREPWLEEEVPNNLAVQAPIR